MGVIGVIHSVLVGLAVFRCFVWVFSCVIGSSGVILFANTYPDLVFWCFPVLFVK